MITDLTMIAARAKKYTLGNMNQTLVISHSSLQKNIICKAS
jgi:hypothetical protein